MLNPDRFWPDVLDGCPLSNITVRARNKTSYHDIGKTGRIIQMKSWILRNSSVLSGILKRVT